MFTVGLIDDQKKANVVAVLIVGILINISNQHSRWLQRSLGEKDRPNAGMTFLYDDFLITLRLFELPHPNEQIRNVKYKACFIWISAIFTSEEKCHEYRQFGVRGLSYWNSTLLYYYLNSYITIKKQPIFPVCGLTGQSNSLVLAPVIASSPETSVSRPSIHSSPVSLNIFHIVTHSYRHDQRTSSSESSPVEVRRFHFVVKKIGYIVAK